jgi:DNA polymerase
MRTLSIDIETYSGEDLAKSGVYRYSESPDFEILLLAYAVDDGAVQIIDIASGGKIPGDIRCAITSKSIIKWAFNAQFERVCLSHHLGVWLSPNSWRCSMVWAATLGLPLSLEGVGTILRLEKQKLKEGKDLVRYFSLPCKPTIVNGGRTRNLPGHAPDKWEAFRSYNIRDVEAELGIKAILSKFPVPEVEWETYILDQEINDRGIRLDMELVHQAIACDSESRKAHLTEAQSLTGLSNPNSTQQLKRWLSENGLTVESLSKSSVTDLIAEANGDARLMLLLRRELAKSSVKKYTAMANAICSDGRAHGLLQFYGANRTGRWAGRLIQVQNLPQNHLPDLEQARKLVRDGQFTAIGMLYESVPLVLSELIRTAFVPKEGHRFLVADFSAIEARVIAWLAGEQWRLDVFASHGKIYEASASQMFHVPIDEITKGNPLRQKGKIAELALGYGGSVGALTAMGALAMGVPGEELLPLVKAWRNANPNIVRLWWDVDAAAMKAVRERTEAETHGIRFSYHSGMLFIRLPSGRRLAYVKPRIEKNRFDKDTVTYEGVGESRKWQRIESYGPKFVENIVQATARDLLADALRRVNDQGYKIVMHVHDEIVIETLPDTSLDDLCAAMSETPAWAESLLLRAEGYECDFYKKE